MKGVSLILFALIGLSFMQSQQPKDEIKAYLTEQNIDEIDQYVGQLITITGIVSNTKIPQLLGVDIASDDPDVRGLYASATGVLEKTVVTENEVDPYSANRGAGTFYRLIDPDNGRTVQAKHMTPPGTKVGKNLPPPRKYKKNAPTKTIDND